jgi:hypothetical protein
MGGGSKFINTSSIGYYRGVYGPNFQTFGFLDRNQLLKFNLSLYSAGSNGIGSLNRIHNFETNPNKKFTR